MTRRAGSWDSVRVRVGETGYEVRIGAGLLARAGEAIAERCDGGRVAVVADGRVAALHGGELARSLKRAGLRTAMWTDLPPGEKTKSLGRAEALYRDLVAAGVDRWTPLVVLGGGVAGDLGGFVASTFLRGIPVIHVPSTVVAQVDSSVGGKTAVNFAEAKNLIGTFHQPDLVLADPELLATLGARDYRAGLAEVVKIAVTLRPDLMERLEGELDAVRRRDPAILAAAVRACVEAKAEVVGRDERDRDVRGILNYGHTLGHALEAASRGRMRHGEAVAVGMNGAAWIGERLGGTRAGFRDRQNRVLAGVGLKLTVPGADKKRVADNLKLDKKVRNRKTRFVLTLQVGGASVWPHVPARLVREAVRLVTS